MRKQASVPLVALLLAFAACAQPMSIQEPLNSDGYGGKGSTIKALQTEGKPATVIVLHGLGGNGQEWGYLFLPVSLLSLTYVKFILPTAPVRYVTYLNETMPSWFDISVLNDRDEISKKDMRESVERLNNIIKGEMKSGLPPERIFLMGFSQGGGLALTTFLKSEWRLGGCMGVATWLPLRNDYPEALSRSIKGRKTLLIHGTKDEVIKISYARKSKDLLNSWNLPVSLHEIKDGPHTLFNKEVLDLLDGFILAEAPGPARALSKMATDLTQIFEALSAN